MPTLSIPLHTRNIPYPFLTATERGLRAELAMIMTGMNPIAFRNRGRRSSPLFMTLVERRLHEMGLFDLAPKKPEPEKPTEDAPVVGTPRHRAAHEALHRPCGLHFNPTPVPQRSTRAAKKRGPRRG